MFPELDRYPYFSYDTETTGLVWEKDDRVFSFSISLPDGRDFYFDIRQQPEAWEWWLQSAVKHYRGIIICHNAAFDFHISRVSGVLLPLDRMDDTSIRACLINEHLFSYDLDNVALRSIGRKKVDIVPELQAIFGGHKSKNVQFRNLPYAPVDLVSRYGIGDSRLTLDLWEWQEIQIEKQGLQEIVEFERRLMPRFILNEQHGIRVDTDKAEKAVKRVTRNIDKWQKELDSLAGFATNVNSRNDIPLIFKPKFQDGIWYSKDKIELNTTPGGNASFNAEALLRMSVAGSNEATLVVELRKLLKLRDTFLRGHILSREVRGRIHPRIHQTKGEDGGTGTGRLSYSDPAMQQVPSRDKVIGKAVRESFLPEEGHSWVESDMQGFEVRGFFHLCKSAPIIEEFRRNPKLDLHQYVADVTGLPRDRKPEGGPYAKQLNLAMMYVQGDGTTAAQMDMPCEWITFLPNGQEDIPGNYITYRKAGEEAQRIIDTYHRRIPGIKKFQAATKRVAIERGYLYTCMGRHLRFPGGRGAHAAAAILSQATAAEWNKQNWELVEDALDGEGQLLLNTHDSYSLSLPIGKEKEIATRVKDAVEGMERSRIPLILEINKPGKSWWDAYKKESEGWL